MKTTVGSFAKLVDRDYGAEIATEFLQKFPKSSSLVGFREAMDALDRVLLGHGSPSFPSFGATTSQPQDGDIVYRD
jgi:hypothetical protein